jgi:DNA-directed RNA polymerase specialized sigma24 family protein
MMSYNPEDFVSLARSVARSFARDWPGIDADDLHGELNLKLVEKRHFFEKTTGNLNGAVGAYLRKYATEYCAKERYRAVYGTPHYMYGTDEVAVLLEVYYLPRDAWAEASPTATYGREKTRDGRSMVTALIDVDKAYQGLTEAQASTLRDDWEHGPQEAAKRNDKSLATWSRAHSRAVMRLRDLMNNERLIAIDAHDGPGARKRMSNSTAQVITNR